MQQPERGLLYVVTGEQRFLDEAITSVRSAKWAMPDVPITLVTDLDASGPWDQVRRVPPTDDVFRLKIEHIHDTPYERTVFLDADTYVVRDVSELFGLLEHFDLAAAHDTHRVAVPLDGIPESYPEFNTGVIAYRAEAMKRIADRWLDLYDSFGESESGAYDQPGFRRALYESDLRVATLPPEFNCRFLLAGFYNIPVAILHAHATEEQFRRAAETMTDLDPTFWSQYVHIDGQVLGPHWSAPHGAPRKLLDLRHPWLRYRWIRRARQTLRSVSRGARGG